jgi:hypothetical protein
MAWEMHVSNEDKKAFIKTKMEVNLKKKNNLDITISKWLGIWEF